MNNFPGPRCSLYLRKQLNYARTALDDVLSKEGKNSQEYEKARKRYEHAFVAWQKSPEGIKLLRETGNEELAEKYLAERAALIAEFKKPMRSLLLTLRYFLKTHKSGILTDHS